MIMGNLQRPSGLCRPWSTAAIHPIHRKSAQGFYRLTRPLRTMAGRPRSRMISEPMVLAFFTWLWPMYPHFRMRVKNLNMKRESQLLKCSRSTLSTKGLDMEEERRQPDTLSRNTLSFLGRETSSAGWNIFRPKNFKYPLTRLLYWYHRASWEERWVLRGLQNERRWV